jgi:hypothetical protein
VRHPTTPEKRLVLRTKRRAAGKYFTVPGSMDETPYAPVADETRFFNRLTLESGGTSLAPKTATGDP